MSIQQKNPPIHWLKLCWTGSHGVGCGEFDLVIGKFLESDDSDKKPPQLNGCLLDNQTFENPLEIFNFCWNSFFYSIPFCPTCFLNKKAHCLACTDVRRPHAGIMPNSCEKLCSSVSVVCSQGSQYCWWFRNPALVEVGNLSNYLRGFIFLYILGGALFGVFRIWRYMNGFPTKFWLKRALVVFIHIDRQLDVKITNDRWTNR